MDSIDNAEQILVVILSSVLAIFLVLGCLALVKINQLLNHLNSISEKAEKLASTAESVGDFFKYTAGPAAIGRLITNISDAVMKHHKKSKGDKDYE